MANITDNFTALIVDETEGANFTAQTKKIQADFLANNDVLVEVHYSSVNYKDALAVTNKGKIVREFPFIPGIDFAGVVLESNDEAFQVGDMVLATGFGIGERYFGGYSQYVWAKKQWLTKLPEGLSAEDAMFVGTGGFTAMLCVDALLENGLKKEAGDVLVSGASGGVGSYAVMILSQLGFDVVALSQQKTDYLLSLGAKSVLPSSDMAEKGRPLDAQKWAGAVDVVGGMVLSNILSQMNYGASVAACGLAGGFKLETTVMPFILRGVKLIGVDSVYFPSDKRLAIWQKIATLMPGFKAVEKQVITMEELPTIAETMLRGQINGRVVVSMK